MATVKVKFRESSVAGREGTLYCQVTHLRVARQIHTDFNVFPHEWDVVVGNVIVPENCNPNRAAYLQRVAQETKLGVCRLEQIIDGLQQSGIPFTSDDIVRTFHSSDKESVTWFSFMESVTEGLSRAGKVGTSRAYTSALRSLRRFRKGEDFRPAALTQEMVGEYETHLLRSGVCRNTSSMYMRCLRAVYNRAVERGLAPAASPFKHVYTGIDKTVKRAVPLSVIKQIKALDLPLGSSHALARDLFLLYFYTRGMSFIDMAFLKKSDLRDGTLTYTRHKTKQCLAIRWEPSMQEIIARYDASATAYLLPIITREDGTERRQYENALHLINNKLKQIALLAGLRSRLTMYVARHSWASIAHAKHIPLAVISEAMGHDSETTTQIYLASLSSDTIDRANRQILKDLQGTGKRKNV